MEESKRIVGELAVGEHVLDVVVDGAYEISPDLASG